MKISAAKFFKFTNKRAMSALGSALLVAAAVANVLPQAAEARPNAVFTMAPARHTQPIALVDGTLVDVKNGTEIENAVILIQGDRIVATGRAGEVEIPEGAATISMKNKWIAPGLINNHVHLGLVLPGAAGNSLANESVADRALRMAENARKAVYSGVTTVRLIGEVFANDYALKRAINLGRIPGPRIETAGHIIVPTGGHGSKEVDGPYGFAQAVRNEIAQGATWIKLAISAGIADTHGDIAGSPMTSEELQVAIESARRLDVMVTAHNGSPIAADEAIRLGVNGFEHGYYLSEKNLKAMKDKTIWLVPTIVVSQKGALEFYQKIGSPDWYLDRVRSVSVQHWDMLKNAIKIGTPIAMGTDQFPHEPNEGTTASVRETELYVDAGMTNLQALQSATINAAKMLRRDNEVGSIEPGRYADLIAMDASPLQNISALRTINFVMKGGEVMRNDAHTKGAGVAAPQIVFE